jgi:nitrite reductase/ring-hydroxylating ferredoxin subunit
VSEDEVATQVPEAPPEPDSEVEWQVLAEIDPSTVEFPVRTRCGGDAILVFRTGDGFRGVERSCPHQKRPLNDAILQGGDKLIRCRWHSYVFRLSDGKAVNCPGYRLRVFDVKQENGALFVRPAS